jgi:hypothetical protein
MSRPSKEALKIAKRVMNEQANHYSSLDCLASDFDNFANRRLEEAALLLVGKKVNITGQSVSDMIRSLKHG